MCSRHKCYPWGWGGWIKGGGTWMGVNCDIAPATGLKIDCSIFYSQFFHCKKFIQSILTGLIVDCNCYSQMAYFSLQSASDKATAKSVALTVNATVKSVTVSYSHCNTFHCSKLDRQCDTFGCRHYSQYDTFDCSYYSQCDTFDCSY